MYNLESQKYIKRENIHETGKIFKDIKPPNSQVYWRYQCMDQGALWTPSMIIAKVILQLVTSLKTQKIKDKEKRKRQRKGQVIWMRKSIFLKTAHQKQWRLEGNRVTKCQPRVPYPAIESSKHEDETLLELRARSTSTGWRDWESSLIHSSKVVVKATKPRTTTWKHKKDICKNTKENGILTISKRHRELLHKILLK